MTALTISGPAPTDLTYGPSGYWVLTADDNSGVWTGLDVGQAVCEYLEEHGRLGEDPLPIVFHHDRAHVWQDTEGQLILTTPVTAL